MKKLLLILVFLLCAFTMSAQQFVRYYYNVQMIKEGVRGDWYTTNVKVYYNYNNDTTRMKFDVNGTIFDMTQIGGTTKQVTSNGLAYQQLHMTDDSTGDPATVELFDDIRYGVMLIFEGKDNSIQFAP